MSRDSKLVRESAEEEYQQVDQTHFGQDHNQMSPVFSPVEEFDEETAEGTGVSRQT